MIERKKIVRALGLIISIVFIVYLLSQIGYDDVVATFTEVNSIYVVLGFVAYLFSYLFRSLRFRVLLKGDVNLTDLFTIVCVHNLANKILPARTGEISFVYLLKNVHNRATGEGIASLVTARVFDFILILVFFLVSLFSVSDIPPFIRQMLWFVGASLIVLIFLLVVIVWFDKESLQCINRVLHRIKLDGFSQVQFVMRKVEETVESLHLMKTQHVLSHTLVFSAATWATMYLFYVLVLYAFGIRLQLPAIILIVSCIAILPLLPIYSFGGFGTTEVTITVLLVAFGVANETAVVVSFGAHIVAFMYAIIAGIYGLLILLKFPRRGILPQKKNL